VASVTVLSMSGGELQRLEVLRDVDRGDLPVSTAAQLLRRSERQVWRLLKAFRAKGAAGLISKKRGRSSNRKTATPVRAAVLWIVRENYADFGPTLAAEKLAAEHGFSFSSETVRKWMIAEGLWLDRRQRQRRVHQPRPRRECVGELVQVDGSEHWWFEDRGPQCTLLVFVDDATSRLMHLQFIESESTFAYFHAARAYLEAWGKPIAFYSDRHGVFRVNHPGALGGDGMTQFGRALHALNIDIICANSSPAKGRVERANKALQDRLVKDLHRRLGPGDDLEDAFAWKEERTLSRALTLQYDKVLFILEPSELAKAAIGKRVTVIDYPDGRLAIRYRGIELAYRTFDKLRQVDQGAIADNKQLGAVLAMIRAEQLRREPERRSDRAPRRRDQHNTKLFKVG
jgi:transposase